MVSAQFPSFKRPPWLQRLSPSWLAGIISVGFHGVLFAAGPSFPSLGFNGLTEPELAAEKRNVPLVELSPAEQERLPDFDRSFYSFDSFEDLAPLTPLFESDLEGTGVDDSLSKPLPTLRDNRPLTTPSARLPFGITTLETWRRPTTTLPPLAQTPRPLPQASPAPPELGTLPPALPPGTTPQSGGPNRPGNPDEPSAADLERQPTDPDGSAGDADGTAIAARRNPTEVLTLEERLLAYSYDATATTEEDATLLWDDWLAAGEAWAADLEIPFELPADPEPTEGAAAVDDAGLLQAPIELPIDYTQQFCLTKEPHKGLIGVWVSPEGGLLGEPVVLRSTGYSGLNRQAMQYIQTLDFSAVQAFTGYQFEVVVDYDPENCTELGQFQPSSSGEVAGDRPLFDTSADEKPAQRSEKGPATTDSTDASEAPEANPSAPAASPEADN
jgi:hypothetical protein